MWTQELMRGGHRGAVSKYRFVCNKPESKLLSGEVKYSWSQEHLGVLPSTGVLDNTNTCQRYVANLNYASDGANSHQGQEGALGSSTHHFLAWYTSDQPALSYITHEKNWPVYLPSFL